MGRRCRQQGRGESDSERTHRAGIGPTPRALGLGHARDRARHPAQEQLLSFDRYAVGPDGSTYVADGYGNSRIAKFSKEGNLVHFWGMRGAGPGEFNTPHSLVIDNEGLVYVGDRANSRIQVFDGDGNFRTQWRLRDVPGGEMARSSEPWSLCITPGPDQKIFMGSVGRVFKLDLEGNVVDTLGKLGRLPGWFDSIHALACPDENTLYLAQEFSYRFDKVILE